MSCAFLPLASARGKTEEHLRTPKNAQARRHLPPARYLLARPLAFSCAVLFVCCRRAFRLTSARYDDTADY
ncbi:MAG: hypothetical protein LBT53_03400 [Puniceicoccales bacterium]|nr:hypothetical protein [Puniceicoccales bacterium]